MSGCTMLRITTPKFERNEDAQDSLAGSRAVAGFKFGYVTPDNRVVAFWQDTNEKLLPKNVERVHVNSMFDMFDFLARQRAFSEKTFGPHPRAKGVIAHIKKELVEIENNPTDVMEWIDVVLLALDGAWRTGASAEQITRALESKLRINQNRTWPSWLEMGGDDAIEHKPAR